MQSVRRICLSFRVCLFWFFAFAFGTSIFATYFVTTKPKIPVRSTPPDTAHLPPPPDTPKKKCLHLRVEVVPTPEEITASDLMLLSYLKALCIIHFSFINRVIKVNELLRAAASAYLFIETSLNGKYPFTF